MLGHLEYQVISTIVATPGGAYGAAIRDRLNITSNRTISPGAIASTLSRLECKGMLTSWWSGHSPTRGGRRKRYYKLESSGLEAMEAMRQFYLDLLE